MKQQRGSVIIIVLWTSILLTVLVTVMAGKVQLSARTAFHNREAVNDLADITAAMHKAEMELMLSLMAQPVDQEIAEDEEGNLREPFYRYNGQPLTLQYPTGDNMVVRIYNHAGKINLNRMRRDNMRQLIETRLGEGFEPQQVQDLVTAWEDWTDLNDLPGINGAERDYYESLDPPYTPRNHSQLDTVEELRLIRGFDELFRDVNLDAAFTIYGNETEVNINLATREAMQLLPGLTDELIEEIILYRQERDFRNTTSVGEVVPLENFVELQNWLTNNTSTFYSVFAYPKADSDVAEDPLDEQSGERPDDPADEVEEVDTVTQAYMEIMEVVSYENRARVYKVDPYARLPDTAAPKVED